MAKVLVVQAFHADGMRLLEARPDVSCESSTARSRSSRRRSRTPTA